MANKKWQNTRYWHPTGRQYKMDLGPDGKMRPFPLNPPGIPRKLQHRSHYDPHTGYAEMQRRRTKNA